MIRRARLRDSRTGRVRERWVVDVMVYDGGRPRRMRRFLRTKAEARQVERELLGGAEGRRTVRSPRPSRIRLEAFAPRFLAHQAAEGNSPSELANKESILRVHLLPAFGALGLDEITSERVAAYRISKIEAGLKPKTVGNHLSVLRRIFTVAKQWGLVESAPHIPLPKKRELCERPIEFLEVDECRRLLAAAEEVAPRYALLFHVAIRSGLRLGELRALRWEDLDLDRGVVHVHRSFTDAAHAMDSKSGGVEEPGIRLPKHGKTRSVPLPAALVRRLVEHRRTSRHRLVFPGDGRRTPDVVSRNAVRRALARAARRAGIGRKVHFHMLRHTYASHLVMSGVDIRTVQELLGHQSLEMTMRYAHLSTHHKVSAVDRLPTLDATPEPDEAANDAP